MYYEPREYNQIIDDMEIRYNEGIATRDMVTEEAVTAEALVKEYAQARGYTLNEDYRDSHSELKACVAKEDFTNLGKLREALLLTENCLRKNSRKFRQTEGLDWAGYRIHQNLPE